MNGGSAGWLVHGESLLQYLAGHFQNLLKFSVPIGLFQKFLQGSVAEIFLGLHSRLPGECRDSHKKPSAALGRGGVCVNERDYITR